MSTHELRTFLATYDWAQTWQDLPWAHAEPTLLLAEICRQRPAGRALDLGCGAGTDSVYLAGRGWDVTALDFVPKALEYTRTRAAAAGATVTAIEADITTWEPPGTWELVLDHGLLHNLDPVRHTAYRTRVLQALGAAGDFLLLHWHPRFPGQPNGRLGPRRVERAEIEAFFAPELQLRYFALEEFEDLPDAVGGGMSQACYWFTRNRAHAEPQELLAQIRRTLQRHGVSVPADAGTGLAPAHLARLLGPGRLGISHRAPEPAAAAAMLEAFAGHAGADPQRLACLFAAFASGTPVSICDAGAPKCSACEVRFCKRQRYR